MAPTEVTMATNEQTPTDQAGSAPRARGSGGRGRLVGLGLAVVALVVLFRVLPVQDWLLGFVAWIRDAGVTGMAVFVAAYVAATVLFLPGSILTLGAGFAYGVALGTPLVWVAANVGATLAFLLGRTLARDAIARRVAGNARFAAIDQAVGREGLKIVLLTRLSPVFPFNLLNYAYGLTRVSLRDYVVGSLVGMVPGTLMYVYLGSLVTSLTALTAGQTSGGTAEQALYFLGLAATVAVTVVVTRVARRALDQATHEEPAERSRSPIPPSHPPAPGPDAPLVLPDDEHNRELLRHVHPPGRVNPPGRGRYNLVAVGGGTAGLVSAAGGAGLGARVALVERHLLGGDCLNVGCVPSKALISAARAAAGARRAGALGVRVSGVEVDFPAVMERMRRLRAKLAPIDGVERFTGLGVDVFLGQARFTGPRTLEVDGRVLEFSRAVVTTGARAAAPDVPGLTDVDHLTNENLFWLTELPGRLLVIGAGPIGCEMAQAFRAFGSEVTVLHADDHVLPREDADAAAVVERRLEADGVRLLHAAHPTRVERAGGEIVVHYERGGATASLRADELLVGIGRTPNLEGLGLEAAGIEYDRHGVRVDDYLRTTNPRVYAAGDVASRFKFTHTADAAARIVLTNALFAGRRKTSALVVPWCTYTTPELAHVGLSEAEAAERGIEVQRFTIPLAEVDRALLDGEDEGFLRVLTAKGSDRIVGATLVAAHAGDMISELTLAMAGKIGLGTIANTIHPYPTQAEAIRKAGDAYNRTRLTPLVKRLFRTWLRMRR
jgi:pyruvate/2-oxoglutarate dehydrogenase complex dihydrolipoamide dehydrogenase (E3) component/uncharacterized membrane protein YdjX (TVP38/TMEM64 family)